MSSYQGRHALPVGQSPRRPLRPKARVKLVIMLVGGIALTAFLLPGQANGLAYVFGAGPIWGWESGDIVIASTPAAVEMILFGLFAEICSAAAAVLAYRELRRWIIRRIAYRW